MKITDLFIRRPVIAIVVNLVIVIAGIQAIRSLTVRQYPRSENAAITITTAYVGANAELVRGFITTPIERAIAAADGIDYISSESRQGVSIIRANLDLNYDAVRALSEIGAKVDQVRGDLPPEAEIPVLDVVSVDSQFASAYLSFSSDFLKQNEITDYLVRAIQPRLSAVDGVQRAEILGARTFAMRVWLNPERMAAHKIGPAQVRNALAANNYLAAVGQTKGALIQVNLTTNTDLESVEEFKRLVVREQDDAIVRLEDIAEVALGAVSYDDQVNFTGATAVFIGVWVLPNSNALDVVKRVRTELEAIREELPEQLRAEIAYDATKYIDSAIREVVTTLSETLAIVIVVIFLFLGSFRAVIVPVVAIPISLIGAVFLMQLFGFTINLLTLLAIVLSVGLVVDDAIVMVENIERHLREGMSRTRIRAEGSARARRPGHRDDDHAGRGLHANRVPRRIDGSALPGVRPDARGCCPDLRSRRHHAFPGDVCELLARREELARTPRAHRPRLRSPEGRLLARARPDAQRPAGHLSRLGGAQRARCGLVRDVATRARPQRRPGRHLRRRQHASELDARPTRPLGQSRARDGHELPRNRVHVSDHHAGRWFLGHGSQALGRAHADCVRADALGGRGRQRDPRDSDLSGPAARAPRRRRVPGGVRRRLDRGIESTFCKFVQELQKKAAMSGLFAFPPLIDVKIDQPESQITFDRDKVAELGLSLQAVGQELGSAVGGNYVNRFSISGRSYKVIPQLERSARLNADQLQDVYVTKPDGDLIALSTFATVEDRVVPRSLNRFQQLNSVKLSGVAIRPLDEALSFLETEAETVFPRGYSVDYTGESRQLRKEGNKFVPAFALAVVLIFLVLAAQFNSFRDPLVILGGSVPLAMFGASIFTFLKMPDPNMHYWTDGWTTTLNVYSQVGLVTLIGLVSKNGILIVEFANELQREGQAKLEAVRNAAGVRLRPILMTTTATVFGHFPLTLVTGPGAEARNSIGLVLVGGMAIGTIFTLFFVPSIYMLFAKDRSASPS